MLGKHSTIELPPPRSWLTEGLIVLPRLASNFWSSSLYLLDAEITGVHHNSQQFCGILKNQLLSSLMLVLFWNSHARGCDKFVSVKSH
jgi:hypothetical protein